MILNNIDQEIEMQRERKESERVRGRDECD